MAILNLEFYKSKTFVCNSAAGTRRRLADDEADANVDYDLITDESSTAFVKRYGGESSPSPAAAAILVDGGPFGEMNEIELSGDVLFSQRPRIDRSDRGVREMTRSYFKNSIELHTEDDAAAAVKLQIVYRREDVAGRDSVKLKLWKTACRNDGDVKIYKTGSIEVPIGSPRVQGSLVKSPRTLHILYWFLTFDSRGSKFRFRVAFRTNARSGETVCNIECEDDISDSLFVVIYHMLVLYYISQYRRFDGRVRPLMSEFPLRSLAGLTDRQIEIAETVKLASDADSQQPQDHRMLPLIRYLGVRAMLSYHESGTVASGDFDKFGKYIRENDEAFKNFKTGINIADNCIVYKE